MLSATLAAVALAGAGLVAGLTGTWSPCGFSMVDTLGPHGHAGGRRRTAAACAAFAIGAPVGGAITFGALAALGSLLQSGGAALGLAAAIAVGAAALDASGVLVAPQLRRQVPESWRRVLPLPLAAGLYGVLLGLGFTTYVLSFALPALAAVSVAVADVSLGLVLGVAFGVGRALPIVVLAPLADRALGARAITAMAERPALLRGARAADALALVAVAAVLVGGEARAASGPASPAAPAAHVAAHAARPTARAAANGPPTAAERVAQPAADPSAADGLLAWSVPGGEGRLAALGAVSPAGGRWPALGGGRLAVVVPDGTVRVTALASGAARSVAAPGADALAVSARWLAWRVPGPDRILVLDLADPAAAARQVVGVAAPGSLSRPALDGDRLAWATATRRGSAIRALDLAASSATAAITLRREPRLLVTAPALNAGALLWVRSGSVYQELVIAPAQPGQGGTILLRLPAAAGRDGGRDHHHTAQGTRPEDRKGPIPPAPHTLQSTALDDRYAYVSRLPRAGGAPDVVRLPRPGAPRQPAG